MISTYSKKKKKKTHFTPAINKAVFGNFKGGVCFSFWFFFFDVSILEASAELEKEVGLIQLRTSF